MIDQLNFYEPINVISFFMKQRIIRTSIWYVYLIFIILYLIMYISNIKFYIIVFILKKIWKKSIYWIEGVNYAYGSLDIVDVEHQNICQCTIVDNSMVNWIPESTEFWLTLSTLLLIVIIYTIKSIFIIIM